MWVRFSFRSLLVPTSTSRYPQAPSGVVGVLYRDFNRLHRPLLKRFPLFIWLLFAGLFSAQFPPWHRRAEVDSFRSLVPTHCGEGLALLSALRCSGSRLIYMERALRCARFQPLGVPQKCETKSCTCFLRLPRQSGSGSQGLDWRTLPGCGMPSPLRGPSLSFHPVPISVSTLASRVHVPCV